MIVELNFMLSMNRRNPNDKKHIFNYLKLFSFFPPVAVLPRFIKCFAYLRENN